MATPGTRNQERMDNMGRAIAQALSTDVAPDIETRLAFARSQALERARQARMQTKTETASVVFSTGNGQLAQSPRNHFALFMVGIILAIAAASSLVYMSHENDDDEWVPYDTPASWVVDHPEHDPDTPMQQE